MAGTRGFTSNFRTRATAGYNTVANDNPEFDTMNSVNNNDIGNEINVGSITWEGAGSMGMSG